MNDDWDESSERLKNLYLSMTREQREALRDGRIPYLKGYLLGRKVSDADLKTLREIAVTLNGGTS